MNKAWGALSSTVHEWAMLMYIYPYPFIYSFYWVNQWKANKNEVSQIEGGMILVIMKWANRSHRSDLHISFRTNSLMSVYFLINSKVHGFRTATLLNCMPLFIFLKKDGLLVSECKMRRDEEESRGLKAGMFE